VPKSYTGGSGGTGRDALAGQVKGEEPVMGYMMGQQPIHAQKS